LKPVYCQASAILLCKSSITTETSKERRKFGKHKIFSMAMPYLGISKLHTVEIKPVIVYQQDVILASLQFVPQCLRDEVNRRFGGGGGWSSDKKFLRLFFIY
jgi:hypothetical protein